MPRVPAGAELAANGWQENVGWLLTKSGTAMTFKAGKNRFDIELKK